MTAFLVPASRTDPKAGPNYEATIENPTDLATIGGHVDAATMAQLRRSADTKGVPIWGALDSPGGKNKRVFERMKPGDSVFFIDEMRVSLGATVICTFVSDSLARCLWPQEGDDSADRPATWKYIYALYDVQPLDIGIFDVGLYQRNSSGTSPVQNFRALNDAQERTFLNHLSWRPTELPSLTEGPAASDPISTTSLDQPLITTGRAEQQMMRSHLIPEGEGRCALCQRELPADQLVAPHTEPRQHCPNQERSVTMLTCRLGCNSLLELGYITVGHDGRVKISPDVHSSPDLAAYVDTYLRDSGIQGLSPVNSEYFNWHERHIFRAPTAVAA